MARLLYNDGLDRYGSLRLDPDGPDVLVGRDSSCAVRTTLRSVSRIHCTLRYVDGRCRVFDLGSVNGTFVNNQRVRERALSDGDVIRCGTSFELRYLERDDVAWTDGWLAVLDRDGALLKRTAHHIALGRGFAFLPERFFEAAGLPWVPALFGAAAHQRCVLPLVPERAVELPGARLRAEPMAPLEPVVWLTDRWAYRDGSTVRARILAPLCPGRRAYVRIERRGLDGGARPDLTFPVALDAQGCATLALARLSPGDYAASLSWDGDDVEAEAAVRPCGRWRVVPARLGVVALDVIAQRWRDPSTREVVLRASGPGFDPGGGLLWQSWGADGTCWERGRAEGAADGQRVVLLRASPEAVVRLTLRADAEGAGRLEVALGPPPARDPEPVTVTSFAPWTRLALAAAGDPRPRRCGLVAEERDGDALGLGWHDAEAIVRLTDPPDPTRLEALESLEEVHVAVRPAQRDARVTVEARGVLRLGESLRPELPEGPALVWVGGFARGLPWEGWALRLPEGALRVVLDVPERPRLGAALDVAASVGDGAAAVLFQALDARAEPLLVGRALTIQAAAWVRDLTGALPGGFVARTMHEALDALHAPARAPAREDSGGEEVEAARPPLPAARPWRRSALVQAVDGVARWSARLPGDGPPEVRVVATALSGARWADASVTRATAPAPRLVVELPVALEAGAQARGRVRISAPGEGEVVVALTCDGEPQGEPAQVALDAQGGGAWAFAARPGLWRAELRPGGAPERLLAAAERRLHVLGAPWAQGMTLGVVTPDDAPGDAAPADARAVPALSVVRAWLALIGTWRADDCEAASARLVAAAAQALHAEGDAWALEAALEAALGAWARLSLLWRDGGGFRHRAWPEARTDAGGYDARNRAAALNLLLASALIERALGVAEPGVAARAPLRASHARARWSTLASSTRDLARRANALYGRWEPDTTRPRTAAEAWLLVEARGEQVASVCLEVAEAVLEEVEARGLASAWTSVDEAAFAAALGVALDAPGGAVSRRAVAVARALLAVGLRPHRWAPMSDHIACLILAQALAQRDASARADEGGPAPDPAAPARAPWAFWARPAAAADDWRAWPADGLHAAWRGAGADLEVAVGALVQATLTLGWEPQRGDVALVMLPACLDHAGAPEPCDLIAWMERGEEVAGAIRAVPLEGRPSVTLDLLAVAPTDDRGREAATLVAALINRHDPERRACAAPLRVCVRPLGELPGGGA